MNQISPERVKTILEQAKKCRVAVVGDLMLDVYLSGTADRLSQEAPVPILRARNRSVRLGGAANVIRNIGALGAQAVSFGVVGKDAEADTMRKMLQEAGVETDGILTDVSRRTTQKLRVMAGTQQLVRIDFEDVIPVPAELIRQMAEQLKQQIAGRKLDAVIFEDYAKGLLDKEMVQEIVDLARTKGVYTSLDPHPGHPMEVKHLSLMTPNRSEAFGLAGMYCYGAVSPVEKDENLLEVSRRVLKSWEVESLLITLGAQGMALFRNGEPMTAIPTRAREVFDVSGAGDTVIATYTLCVAAGASEQEAAQISNHAAGIVVGKLGTATASREEILKSVAQLAAAKV